LLYACGTLSRRFNRSLLAGDWPVPDLRIDTQQVISLPTTPNHSNLQVSIVKFQNPMVTCYAPVLRGLGLEHSSSQGFFNKHMPNALQPNLASRITSSCAFKGVALPFLINSD
jgi:hypothetical protein